MDILITWYLKYSDEKESQLSWNSQLARGSCLKIHVKNPIYIYRQPKSQDKSVFVHLIYFGKNDLQYIVSVREKKTKIKKKDKSYDLQIRPVFVFKIHNEYCKETYSLKFTSIFKTCNLLLQSNNAMQLK